MTGKKIVLLKTFWDTGRTRANFHYQVVTDEKTFDIEENIVFPGPVPETPAAEKLLRALHIALATSYYKSFYPPVIEHPYAMTSAEASYWNTVYQHGLAEFIYKNKLDPNHLAKFQAQNGTTINGEDSISWNDNALLGIGGGKDSIVAGELLKSANVQPKGFVLATGDILGQAKQVMKAMQIELLVINRSIDLQILDINKLDGAYNGHIPISLIFGLVGAMLAVQQNSRYVVVANESSASIPQSSGQGQAINHQWSKSLEFERLFQDYLHTYVSEELDYFSAIRPLSSISVAQKLARYPQYFEVFTSDNSVFKIVQEQRDHPRWSLQSSKSLSSFILLAPWLSEADMTKIFGRNFLNEDSLASMLGDLLGKDGKSVLDCVGTPDELRASLSTVIQQGKFSNSSLIEYAQQNQLTNGAATLDSFTILTEHALPAKLESVILTEMKK